MKNIVSKKINLTLTLSLLISLSIHAQNDVSPSDININKGKEYTLELELKGIEYEKLQLIILDNRFTATVINGKKADTYNWKFAYPDNIYQTSIYMQLCIPTEDKDALHIADLQLLKQNRDTIKLGVFNVSPNQKYTALKYNTSLKKNFDFYRGKDVTFDSFIVSEEKVSEFSLAALSTINIIDKTDTINYQPNLEKLISMIKDNNNSHSLLACLRTSLPYFKSKEDIALVYALLSNEMKKSVFGKQINKCLNAKEFTNMQLPNSITGVYEPIVSNISPYAFVSFSASWCGPCHKQIPLLKKAFQDLNLAIEFVYISIDEADTVEEWKKLMHNESIPWRSLLASNEIKKVKDTYLVEYIPLSFLIYPDKTFEIIDIRQEADLKKLYDLFGIPNNN